MADPAASLRIDRWLFFCRFYKTRSRATDAVAGGHVRINDERATPGGRVKCGDRVEMIRERLRFEFEVVAIPSRRGPAAEAQRCFVEDEQVAREREAKQAALRQDRQLMPKTDGRPDKHTRRKLIERRRD